MNIDDKSYDVVILTHAPKGILCDSINMLVSQTVVPQKIIIYNTDETKLNLEVTDKKGITLKQILSNDIDEKIKIINIDECDFDHGKARNDAATFCKSKYILFMTDDAEPYNQVMAENMIKSFDEYNDDVSEVAVVYARQIARNNAKLKEKYVREFNYPEHDIIKEKSKEKTLGIKNYFCSNVCAMYNREIFNKLGQFEENIILNEDTFYVYNAINKGYKVVYCHKAKVLHSHNYSWNEQFRRNFDIGVSQFERKEIFEKIPTAKEGKKMLLFVTLKLLKGLHLITILDFVIECLYRYLGYKKGKGFKKLSINECIKYSSNKNYFIKKKTKIC